MKKLLIPVVLCMLIAGSCKKETPTGGPDPGRTFKTYGSIDEIYDLLSLKPKVVSFDAAAGSSFYGNSGTRYIFQPNCFQDASGTTVTGNVQVEVTEWLKKEDMIFSGVLPISDGKPLVSGGEINVKATKGGSEIFLKRGKPFQASIPQSGVTDTAMKFFRGRPLTGSKDDKVNWILPKEDTGTWTWPTTVVIPKGVPSVVKYQDTFHVFSDSLHFGNADAFLTGKYDNQNFKISIGGNGITISNATQLYTYALFDNQKVVWKCGYYDARVNNIYSEKYVPDVPCHFIAYALIDGHFYGGVFAATPKTGENYTVTLSEVDPAAFKAQIALYP